MTSGRQVLPSAVWVLGQSGLVTSALPTAPSRRLLLVIMCLVPSAPTSTFLKSWTARPGFVSQINPLPPQIAFGWVFGIQQTGS